MSFAKTMTARLAGVGSAVLALACGASGDELVSDCTNGACIFDSGVDRSKDDSPVSPPFDDAPPDVELTRSPLCGSAGCFPGNLSACGPPPAVDGSYYPPVQQQVDAGEEGNAADAEQRDGSSEASDASTDGPDAGSGTSDASKPPQSCYIKRSEADGGVVTTCAPVGPGTAGADCVDSSECGALLACVAVRQRAKCHLVSCGLPISCPPGTYYQTTPLVVDGQPAFAVPVCLPPDNCTLLALSTCPMNEVCAVVGSEGETSCIQPGTAKVGEWCDDANRCDVGLLCSKLTNKCLKICHIGSNSECSAGGTCQGGIRSVPMGFGICVGQDPDGG